MTVEPVPTPQQATLEYYQANAPHYRFGGAASHHRHLDSFLDMLPRKAEILELGAGAGQDAARMVQRGFVVDATDGSSAMARKARERFGIPVRTMAFDELEVRSAYDAVWAHACLLHVPLKTLPSILARIRRALRSGGRHFANFKLSDVHHPQEGFDPLGRWTNLPDEDWLHRHYEAAGFRILSTERYAGAGSDGVQRDWYALTMESP